MQMMLPVVLVALPVMLPVVLPVLPVICRCTAGDGGAALPVVLPVMPLLLMMLPVICHGGAAAVVLPW